VNISKYNISVREAKAFFKECGILKQSYDKAGIFSQEFMEACDSNDPTKIYLTAIKNFDYDVLLIDDSIIQFSLSETRQGLILRYAYYQNPFDVPSYSEYLIEELASPEFDLLTRVIESEYDQIIAEAPLLINLMALRYDYSKKEYTEGVHPVSHFHIGLDNKIKIPLRALLTPHSFSIFILKQVYYDLWKSLIATGAVISTFKKSKEICPPVDPEYFKGLDEYEHYLV